MEQYPVWGNKETWYIVGRLIKEAARQGKTPIPVELPPLGALVVEATHASWYYRGPSWPIPSWPIREAVGWVERIEPEDLTRPLSETNSRVILRLFDPGDGEPLQSWCNANFYVGAVPQEDDMSRHDRPPTCPYCGATASYGDSRLAWMSAHLDSRLHRWWWKMKKFFKRGKK